MKGTALFILACSLAPFIVGGCAHDQPSAAAAARPGGPCRDDENLDSGRCVTRFPGDGLPHNPNPPVPR